VAHRDDRGPTRHGFNHRNPEWLRPVDGKQICERVSQEVIFLRFVNFSYELDMRISQ